MQVIIHLCVIAIISITNIQPTVAWDHVGWDIDELDIFDLIEDVNTVNKNFYEYMDIQNDASTSEVRKAYRRLSLVLHPDKNDAADAEEKFRWLAAIYDVLKDSKKREIYDRVLVDGVPDRNIRIIIRRMRTIGLAEGLGYLLAIATIIQYAVNWAAYWERKFTMRENVSAHLNKRSTQKKVKRAGKEVDADTIEKELENELEELGYTKPSIYGLLPFQIFRGAKGICVGIPQLPSQIYAVIQEHKRTKDEEEKRLKEEAEEIERKENEKKDRKEQQRQRKLAQKQYEEKEGVVHDNTNKSRTQVVEEARKLPRNAQQLWTDDDLCRLAKLIKKYPGGTPDRWERIAEIMERLPWEVTKMAGTIKGSSYQVPVQQRQTTKGVPGLESDPSVIREDHSNGSETSEEDESYESDSDGSNSEEGYGYTVATKEQYEPPDEIKKKTKTKGGKQGIPDDNHMSAEKMDATADSKPDSVNDWSQIQQKALEQSIKFFPKGTDERWERIASKVVGKNKEECILRYRFLAELVKKKKELESTS